MIRLHWTLFLIGRKEVDNVQISIMESLEIEFSGAIFVFINTLL